MAANEQIVGASSQLVTGAALTIVPIILVLGGVAIVLEFFKTKIAKNRSTSKSRRSILLLMLQLLFVVMTLGITGAWLKHLSK